MVLIPAVVPVSMSVVFAGLRGRLTARTAYNVGFAVYWVGWCAPVSLWILGRRTAVRLLTAGLRPSAGDAALLALPVAGAIGTQLVPYRRDIDAATGAVMVASALVNAVAEELLWRGLFIHELAAHRRLAMVWSLIGFSSWHLAPQLVLPSAMGRWRFVAGSAVVGMASTVVACRAGGLRYVIAAHVLTDACGVTAARFRLGRSGHEEAVYAQVLGEVRLAPV